RQRRRHRRDGRRRSGRARRRRGRHGLLRHRAPRPADRISFDTVAGRSRTRAAVLRDLAPEPLASAPVCARAPDEFLMELQINIDCADLDRMVDFYVAALDYVPYGSAGVTYRSIVPAHGTGPKIVFQKVPEAKVVKNRVHLDVIVGDRIEAEAERFIGLGA